MAAPYDGNPVAVESPSLAFGPGIVPRKSLPADTDGATWANIYQEQKLDADGLAYLMNGHFSSFYQENFLMASTTYTAAQAPIPSYANLKLLVNGTHWSVPFGGGQAQIGSSSTVSGDYCYTALSAAINNNSLGNSSQYSVEFDLATVGAASVTGVARVGLGDNAQLDAAANFAYLMTAPPASTWTLNVNGTTAVLSAGFNPSATQRIRINGFGSATARGVANGSAFTEVWINNVVAATVNVCATTALFPSFGIKAAGAVLNTPAQTCNCITARWNRF